MENEIVYKFKRNKRAKHIRLAVFCDGSVVITTPFWTGRSIVKKFICEKKQWILDKMQLFKSVKKRPIKVFSRKEYLAHKERARQIVHERVKLYNELYGFSFNKIFIKNQKTRWGSCSKNGNLNINYRVVFLSEQQQDYIIVHELCHLQEFNHSKKFWALVEKTCPNYANIRKELRRLVL